MLTPHVIHHVLDTTARICVVYLDWLFFQFWQWTLPSSFYTECPHYYIWWRA